MSAARSGGVGHPLVLSAAKIAGALVLAAASTEFWPRTTTPVPTRPAPQAESAATAAAHGSSTAALVRLEDLAVRPIALPTVEIHTVRDVFAFVAAPAEQEPVPSPRSTPLAATPVLTAPAVVLPPALPSLIGVAERRVGTTPDRAAIFAIDGEAILARVGDTVLGEFSVEAIGADSVELRDLTTRAMHALRLR